MTSKAEQYPTLRTLLRYLEPYEKTTTELFFGMPVNALAQEIRQACAFPEAYRVVRFSDGYEYRVRGGKLERNSPWVGTDYWSIAGAISPEDAAQCAALFENPRETV